MGTRRVLVVGGAGYIGSHAAKALAECGYAPVVFDDLSAGHSRSVQWGPLVHASLESRSDIARTLREYEPVAVLHFAAHAYVGESVENPAKYYRNNVANTLNLLEELISHGVKALVFSSTCATYGVPDSLPIVETTPQLPTNPYGHSKLVVERMLQAFSAAYGLRSVSLRYFNAAGADQGGAIGEDHEPETHLIPNAIRSALGDRGPFEVFGTDYSTMDGTAVRDFIHVSDLASAHVLALQHLLRGASSTAFNLGLGRGFSVRDVLASVERVVGTPVPTVDRPRRRGDPPALVADASLAREALGWYPRYTELDEIIATAVNWFAPDADMPSRSPQRGVDRSVRTAERIKSKSRESQPAAS